MWYYGCKSSETEPFTFTDFFGFVLHFKLKQGKKQHLVSSHLLCTKFCTIQGLKKGMWRKLLQSSYVNRIHRDSFDEFIIQNGTVASCRFQIHLCISARVMRSKFTREVVMRVPSPEPFLYRRIGQYPNIYLT